MEESGIVFIDEIDKLVTRGGDYGPDVSGEGVQRDFYRSSKAPPLLRVMEW